MKKEDTVLAGFHAVSSRMKRDSSSIRIVYYDPKRRDQRMRRMIEEIEKAGIRLMQADNNRLDGFSHEVPHQGLIALAAPIDIGMSFDTLMDNLAGNPLLLLLDGVTDPRNFGACLRVADAAGVSAVITPKDRSATLTAAAVKASAGASETVPIVRVTNLAGSIVELVDAGVPIIGTAGEAQKTIYEFDQLEEEDPQLNVVWDGHLGEIQLQLMGEVQIEVLKSLIAERFGVEVEFGTGNIVYKETIAGSVKGVGHFEPLRHYAEVHLLLEPGERGSGLQFAARCSEDVLDRSWQRLVLTHLEEKVHKGVLTGSPITDMQITLVAGRAHIKHTEGGDFRQATYRALRQGLMEAESILLEPWYEFRLEIPDTSIGRAMTDIEKRSGTCSIAQSSSGMAVLTGSAPVAAMGDYQTEVTAYTKGCGKLTCTMKGYEPCHDTEAVMERIGYDPERDTDNPTGSVFCAHGAGFVVGWDHVKEYMHVDSGILKERLEQGLNQEDGPAKTMPEGSLKEEIWLGTEEIDAILNRTFYANSRDKARQKTGIPGKGGSRRSFNPPETRTYRGAAKQAPQEEYLLVDGYNIIYAWEELNVLAKDNMEGARGRLMDLLCN